MTCRLNHIQGDSISPRNKKLHEVNGEFKTNHVIFKYQFFSGGAHRK